MTVMDVTALGDLALSGVERALNDERLDVAVEWLRSGAAKSVRKGALAELWYRCAKHAMAVERWGDAATYLTSAQGLSPSTLYAQRLHLVRARKDHVLQREDRGALPKPHRLPAAHFAPDVESVVACGQYHSRGTGKAQPWTRLLRGAKNPPRDEEGRIALMSVATACFCCAAP